MKRFKPISLLGFVFLQSHFLHPQDVNYAREKILVLCSKKYHGRGYYKAGASKAGDYIASEMHKIGLKNLPAQNDYKQYFSFPVNIISKCYLRAAVQVDDHGPFLIADEGTYLVNADAPSIDKTLTDFITLDEKSLADSSIRKALLEQLKLPPSRNYFIDTLTRETRKKCRELFQVMEQHANIVELTNEKLTWTVATEQSFFVHVQINQKQFVRERFPVSNGYKIRIKSSLKTTHQKNVIGYVPGTEKPDSFIFVTAHYDHLGMMGKYAMFPGANDNACGVAMMLDMARYYAKHPAKYSMVFVAFAGEEAGLIGSHYFVENPWVPLHNIRFLFNLDLVGTGEDGGTVVNATIFSKEFALLDSLNKKNGYLPSLKKRGKAANSDHYFFAESGVPCFFIYLAGPRPAYHDVHDVPSSLTLAGYNGTFRLLVNFFSSL